MTWKLLIEDDAWIDLEWLFQVTEGGKYCLVLVFEAKALQLSDFEQRQVDPT